MLTTEKGIFWSSLHVAANLSNLTTFQILIQILYTQIKQKFVEILNAVNEEGNSCLMVALVQKKIEVVKFLVDELGGIDLNLKNIQDLSVLKLAKTYGLGEMFKGFKDNSN